VLPDDLRRRYLERLGLDAEPPSEEGLVRLHRAHVERVPYETLWIQTGERRGIDPAASVNAIVGGRGGYCFQLNGALALLLDSLGYDVTLHVGGVHGPEGPSLEEMGNHLVLHVHGLDAEDPGLVWYVDAGLGDALHEPLALSPQRIDQGPFALSIEPDEDGPGEWHLTHDPAGSFVGMSWRVAPTTIDTFAARHVELSTSPESGFVRFLTVQRRDGTGADVLRGLVLRRIGEPNEPARDIESLSELIQVLNDVFAIDTSGVGDPALRTLWDRLDISHREWDDAGRP
jgi:arylamine N-acetyltransferase